MLKRSRTETREALSLSQVLRNKRNPVYNEHIFTTFVTINRQFFLLAWCASAKASERMPECGLEQAFQYKANVMLPSLRLPVALLNSGLDFSAYRTELFRPQPRGPVILSPFPSSPYCTLYVCFGMERIPNFY